MCLLGVADGDEPREEVLRVESSAALIAALARDRTARRIHLARGSYPIDRPLQIPDHTTLSGDGVMRFDGDGLPLGFEPGSATILEVTVGFPGDLLTLGNGATIRGLELRDLASDPARGVERAGNVVAIASRAPNDRVEASIVECVINNPGSTGFAEEGPTGHGILLVTRNPRRQRPPPPHEDATIGLRLDRSVVHAVPDGGGIFAINFASAARIDLSLSHNWVDGTLAAAGGVSRTDAVVGARVTIDSGHNRYTAASAIGTRGWSLYAASSAPHYRNPATVGPSSNVLRMHSVDDRIERVSIGILGGAARRIVTASGPLSGNRLELELERLGIRTVGADAADLRLETTVAYPDATQGTAFAVGERNVLRVHMVDSTGSGPRANVYAVGSAPSIRDEGAGNRLEFVGTAEAFERRNTSFEPGPPPALFVGASEGVSRAPAGAKSP